MFGDAKKRYWSGNSPKEAQKALLDFLHKGYKRHAEKCSKIDSFPISQQKCKEYRMKALTLWGNGEEHAPGRGLTEDLTNGEHSHLHGV